MRAILPDEFRDSRILGAWIKFLIDILGSKQVRDMYTYDSEYVDGAIDLQLDCDFEDRVRRSYQKGNPFPVGRLKGCDSIDDIVYTFREWEDEVFSDLGNIESKEDYERYLSRLAKRAKNDVTDPEKSIKLEREIARDFAVSRGYITTGSVVDNRSQTLINLQGKAENLLEKAGYQITGEIDVQNA